MRSCYCGSHNKIKLINDIPLVLPDNCNLEPFIRVVQCGSCGFVYSDTNLNQADYDEYYSKQDFYSEPHKDLTKYVNDTYDFCKEYTGKSVLDIGCGGGQFLKCLKENGIDKVHGIDTCKKCVDSLVNDGISCIHGSMFSTPEIGRYDLITCIHILEHVLDLNEFTRKLCSSVHKHLYIEVPDGSSYPTYPPFQDFNIEHINHFTLGSLIRLFEIHGLRCVKTCSEKKIHGNYGALCCMFTKEPNGIKKYIEDSQEIFESIVESAPKNEPLCLYGTGQFAYKLLARLPNIKYLVDDKRCRQGTTIRGITITDKIPEDVKVLKTF